MSRNWCCDRRSAIPSRSVPPVIVRDDVRGPCVVGVLRPAVVLPSFMLDRRVELEHAVLHELAHVKRRDPLVNALCLGLHLVYWFHPMVWFARRRLATLREVACDARAVAASGTPDDYRTTLLRLARELVTEPRQPVLGLFRQRRPVTDPSGRARTADSTRVGAAARDLRSAVRNAPRNMCRAGTSSSGRR